ncbi:MAG TPA: HD-GYP domain-containing protein [Anaerovoracaceae bacterium]|nr:HD-GYP domain-containing protein [Anaerovoracaceae bacterium]
MQKRLYRQVFVKDIKNGMIIGKDVLGSKGEILLARGFKITAAFTIRRLLNQHGVVLITILREEPQQSMQKSVNEAEKIDTAPYVMDDEELAKVIDKFSDNREAIKESFDKLVRGEKVEEQEIKEKIENTLKIFKENANVFQIMQNVKHSDDITYSHCHNVALISYTIGRWIGLNKADLEELVLSGMLADIGKVQIDQKLLNKKGELTNDEFVDLKKHSILSHETIKNYDFISDRVKKAVLHHHERVDGSGYPLGLAGKIIPLFARIVAIADVYNALVSDRPHRDKKTPFEAIKVLETEYMDKLDISILYMFLRRIASNYIGQNILLNDGTRGEIVFIPGYNIHRPVIKLQDGGQVIDLGKEENMHLDIVEFF